MATSGSMDRLQGSARLEIDFGEQAELVHSISKLSEELQQSPTVIPTRDKSTLRGVTLRKPSQRQPGAYLSIETTEHVSKQPQAVVVVTDKSRAVANSAVAYHYRSGLEVWEEWRPTQTAPDRIYDNTTMIGILDDQMPTDVLGGLQDHVPTGIEIVHMLVSHLNTMARTRTRDTTYSSSRILLGGDDFATTVDSELRTRQHNGRVQRRLAITAAYLTDMGALEKTYSYETTHTPSGLSATDGRVTISTIDEIPRARLDSFAARDQYNHHPVDSLDHAIEQLREEYGLPI